MPASKRFVKRSDLKLGDHLRLWMVQRRHTRLPFVFAVGFLVMGAFVTVHNYAEFRLIAAPFNLSATACGLISGAYIFGVTSSSSAGALADKLGRPPVLISGLVESFFAGLALTMSNALPAMICGIILITTGFFVGHSVASGWVGRLASVSKGHATSLYVLAYYVGSSVLGSIGGSFWQHGGWTMVVGYVGALLLLCFGCTFRLSKS